MSPLISIIIPAYNSERTLTEALDSIALQKDFNLSESEILVIDDASTDGTIRVAEEWALAHPEWGARIRLLRNPGNLGPAATRNHGLREARAEWMAFLDADDAWLPNKLAIQFQCVADQPEVALWCGQVTEIGTREAEDRRPEMEGGEQISATERSSHIPNEQLNHLATQPQFLDQGSAYTRRLLTLDEFSFRNPVSTSTVLARRAALVEIGGFDVAFRGPEDYDLWLRLATRQRLVFIACPLSYYRATAGSLSRDDRTFMPQVIRVIEKAYRPGGALHGKYKRRVSLAWQMLMGAWMAGERRAYGRAWMWIIKALWQWPWAFPAFIPNRWPRLKLMKALLWRTLRER